ncbi:MAG: carbohydrate-binding protein, partial [Moraxellaceae bacterium]
MKIRLLHCLSLYCFTLLTLNVYAAEVVYKATDNFYSGGVIKSENELQQFSEPGARVIFTINMPVKGNYTVKLRYTNTADKKSPFRVLVNGLSVKDINLLPTDSAKHWKTSSLTLALRAGLNTVIYESISSANNVAIKSLSVDNALPLSTRGATLPYQEFEAEAGVTNAQISGYDTTYLTVEAESSGRRFVSLNTQGHYVEWVAPKKANSLVVRYSIPDSINGGGTSATLNLYVNNKKIKALNLSSHFAWVYGEYPFNDKVSDGKGHRFYDEAHIADINIPAGATVKLQKDADNTAAFYKIDLVDFEQIESACAMPTNFVAVTTYGGAVANDGFDDTVAINNTINYAKTMNMGVWIPAGTFNINSKLNNISNIHIRGAGMWYTILQGSNGQGGFYVTGGNTTIADMSVVSDSFVRNDAGDAAAFEGNFGTGSLVQNVWIEHMKVGFWLSSSTDGLFIVNGRVRDTWADGINIAGGVKNSQMSHFNIRNTGDDAMAMWSTGSANINNAFRFNTVQNPILANAFAIYGGKDNKILDNIGSDTVFASAGIAISNRFKPFPFDGITEVRRNTLSRTGGFEPTYNYDIGAVWIFADETPINAPIILDSLDINDSPVDGVFVSQNLAVDNLSLTDIHIKNSQRYGLYVNVTGAGTFTNVKIEGTKQGALKKVNEGFNITRGTGN